jgi:hypothetical protein
MQLRLARRISPCIDFQSPRVCGVAKFSCLLCSKSPLQPLCDEDSSFHCSFGRVHHWPPGSNLPIQQSCNIEAIVIWQGATLAAWQRFFSHSTPLEEEEEFPLMQRQQAVKEKRQKASGDGSSNCLGWIPRDSQVEIF